MCALPARVASGSANPIALELGLVDHAIVLKAPDLQQVVYQRNPVSKREQFPLLCAPTFKVVWLGLVLYSCVCVRACTEGVLLTGWALRQRRICRGYFSAPPRAGSAVLGRELLRKFRLAAF
eukprot:6199510-Pleurochrysis_carterae.AAC.5